MDLIVHIGFPKTATTTLQKHVFPHVPGYLNKLAGGLSGANPSRELLRILRRPRNYERYLQQWCDEAWARAEQARHPRVLVSSEGISALRLRRGSHQGVTRWEPDGVVERIEQLQTHWRGYGAVRILMTIRRQPELLASHYAQHSNRILRASTRHFEEVVSEVLTSFPENVDWLGWVERLSAVVGKEQVWALPMEGMTENRFWQELGQACGHNLVQTPGQGYGHSNRKRLGDAPQWRLRSFNFRRWDLTRTPWCPLEQPWRHQARDWTAFGLSLPVNFGVFLASPMLRERKLVLCEQTRGLIMQYYRPRNLELAERLGWDLEALGYA